MATFTEFLSLLPQNIVLTGVSGSTLQYLDFGGIDTYTLSPQLAGPVVVTDNQASTIHLPAGLMVEAVQFSAIGVQFTVNGFTASFLGAPADFTFVFAGTPLDPTSGTPVSYAQTAARFGATIPDPGQPPVAGTILGMIEEDGSVSGVVSLAGFAPGATVTAVDGVAEIFLLDFDSVNGTTALSAVDGLAMVSIAGFNPAEDRLWFNDASTPPVSGTDFLTLASVAVDPFAGVTTVALLPALGGDEGSTVTLLGIQDGTLGGVTPFFEMV